VTSAQLEPVRLAPIFVPRIWGARSLAPLFSHPVGNDPIGEVWLTGEQCRVDTGEFAGSTLGEIWPKLPAEWTGTKLRNQPRIPLLVKFIFPEDKLSVQVHPNDEYAREHEGAAQVGKTEMWYAIAARQGAKLRLGLQPNVTAESFQQAIADGTAEASLRSVPVQAGDAFFVPAGTAHTIGPGMVLCEVQQHSDITYRVFDYNRRQPDGTPRPLHIRQALDVLRFGDPRGGKTTPVQVRDGSLLKTYIVACRYFATERWDFSEPVAAATSPEHFELLITISGQGRIEWAGRSAPYGPAEVWLLPAALSSYQLAPDSATALLRTFVPDMDQYTQELASQNPDQPAWSRVFYR
jgi:mannose-6-phosphate isomerase